MEALEFSVAIGIGATLVMDAWGIVRRVLFGMPSPDYRFIGRWLGHMPRGRFRHASIAAATPVEGERTLGWVAHYLVGITFAGLLIGACGVEWVARPTLGPALLVGTATIAAPFLVMQPAMGAGIASSRTPRPGTARLQSLVTHAVFGLGLYVAGWIVHFAAWR